MGLRTWLRNQPGILEWMYQTTYAGFRRMHPIIARIGYDRFSRWLLPIERASKKALFGCQMCGQCILHQTGMVCPMTCPKNLRNGACGGVRINGNCEVIADMKCVWVAAYDRAQEMQVFGEEMITVKQPANHRLEDTSAWINMLRGNDQIGPKGWADLPHNPVIEKQFMK